MIILDATTKTLEIDLDGAVAATQLPVVVSYVDITTTAYTPGSSDTATNNTTAVTILAAPGASTQRQVKFISVYNADSATAAVTISYNNNATLRTIVKASLTTGYTLLYTDGEGWRVLTTTGAMLQVVTNAPPKPFVQWTAAGNNPPSAAYATLDTRNSHLVLDFDGATDEEAVFAGVLPLAYANGGLTIDTYWSFTSATSGSLRVQAALEYIAESTLDVDADSFVTFLSAGGTAPGTSGHIIKVSITVDTSDSADDGIGAGGNFRLKIRRDADGTSGTDDITTDAELHRVVLRET